MGWVETVEFAAPAARVFAQMRDQHRVMAWSARPQAMGLTSTVVGDDRSVGSHIVFRDDAEAVQGRHDIVEVDTQARLVRNRLENRGPLGTTPPRLEQLEHRAEPCLYRSSDVRGRHPLVPNDALDRAEQVRAETGRALMLNANKPGYSERWTYDGEQYDAVAQAILSAMDRLAREDGTVLLKDVVAFVQDQLGNHELFPSGRMTNAARYVKVDLEARGVLQRVEGSSPQALRRLEQA